MNNRNLKSRKFTAPSGLAEFPPEILLIIFNHLPEKHAQGILRVALLWHYLIHNHYKTKFQKHFPRLHDNIKDRKNINWPKQFSKVSEREYRELTEDEKNLLSKIKETDNINEIQDIDHEIYLLSEKRTLDIKHLTSIIQWLNLKNHQTLLNHIFKKFEKENENPLWTSSHISYAPIYPHTNLWIQYAIYFHRGFNYKKAAPYSLQLFWAIMCNQHNIIEEFISNNEKINLLFSESFDYLFLLVATAEIGNWHLLYSLLNKVANTEIFKNKYNEILSIFHTAILTALKFGQINELKELIKTFQDTFKINYSNYPAYGNQALALAIRQGDEEVVTILFSEAKCQLISDWMEKNSAQELVCSAIEGGHLGIVNILLENGALLSKHYRSYPFHKFRYPLCIAVENGDLEMVKFLLEKGEDINLAEITNKQKFPSQGTPLSLAITHNHKDILIELIHHPNIHVKNCNQPNQMERDTSYFSHSYEPFYTGSCRVGDIDITQGDTLLHIAVRMKDKKLIQNLMERGADIHTKNIHGQTSLQVTNYPQIQCILFLMCLIQKRPNCEALFLSVGLPHHGNFTEQLTKDTAKALEAVIMDDADIDSLIPHQQIISATPALKKICEVFELLNEEKRDTHINLGDINNNNRRQDIQTNKKLSHIDHIDLNDSSEDEKNNLPHNNMRDRHCESAARLGEAIQPLYGSPRLNATQPRDDNFNFSNTRDIASTKNTKSLAENLIENIQNSDKKLAKNIIFETLNQNNWTLQDLLEFGERLLDKEDKSLLYLREESSSLLKFFRQTHGNTNTWKEIVEKLQQKIDEKIKECVYFGLDIEKYFEKNQKSQIKNYLKEKEKENLALNKICILKNNNQEIKINDNPVYNENAFLAFKHIRSTNARLRYYDPRTWFNTTIKVEFSLLTKKQEFPLRKNLCTEKPSKPYCIKVSKNNKIKI